LFSIVSLSGGTKVVANSFDKFKNVLSIQFFIYSFTAKKKDHSEVFFL